MLKILSKYSSEERARLLSDVITSLLPNPGIAPQESMTPGYLKKQVIMEVRTDLGLGPEDDSPAAQTKILDYLTKELSQSVLVNADLAAVKARVGRINFNER